MRRRGPGARSWSWGVMTHLNEFRALDRRMGQHRHRTNRSRGPSSGRPRSSRPPPRDPDNRDRDPRRAARSGDDLEERSRGPSRAASRQPPRHPGASAAERAAALTAELSVWLPARTGRPSRACPPRRQDPGSVRAPQLRQTPGPHEAHHRPGARPALRHRRVRRPRPRRPLPIDAHHHGTIATVSARARITAAALQKRRLRYQHRCRASTLTAQPHDRASAAPPTPSRPTSPVAAVVPDRVGAQGARSWPASPARSSPFAGKAANGPIIAGPERAEILGSQVPGRLPRASIRGCGATKCGGQPQRGRNGDDQFTTTVAEVAPRVCRSGPAARLCCRGFNV